jgi:cytochrome c
MKFRSARPLAQALAGALAAVACGVAFADGPRAAVRPLPLYTQECSVCHVAYPPALMGAADWRQVMATLPRHYGTDASLDEATVRALTGWLTAHAGRPVAATPADAPRITRSAWFVREHDEVAPAVWKRAAVGSASNCAACHARAAEGVFDEHDIRIPR